MQVARDSFKAVTHSWGFCPFSFTFSGHSFSLA